MRNISINRIVTYLFLSLVIVFFIYNFLPIPVWSYPFTALVIFIVAAIIEHKQKKQFKPLISGQKLDIEPERKTLQNELVMAKRVQEGLLSVANPTIPGIRIAKRCTPASSVGGDFYTFIVKDAQELTQKPKTPGIIEYIDSAETYLGVVIGDVAGHGVSSALVMALASGLFSEIGKNTKSAASTLFGANNDLLRYLENSQISHVTVFYSIINLRTKELTFSQAGHPPALLYHQDNTIEELETGGIFLGMFDNEEFDEAHSQLLSGDRLFLYTDGLTEAKNSKNEVFGLKRLKDLIQDTKKQSVDSALETIYTKVNAFTGNSEIMDDQTLVILELE